MVPDEEPQAAPEQFQASSSPRRPRRGRRGGRRHSRGRGQRPSEPPPAAGSVPAEESSAPAIQEAERRQEPAAVPPSRSVGQAIEQVNAIIEELKHTLDEMEEVLETLEVAERQKIDDEREIEHLQRALRQLHRPRSADTGQ